MRHGPAQDEPARLQPRHLVDAQPGIGGEQLVNGHAKAARIGEQGGDIAEQDAVVREIDDGADIVFDGFLHGSVFAWIKGG